MMRAMIKGLRLRLRLVVAGAIALGALWLLPEQQELAARLAIAWNAGGLIYLGSAFALMSACDSADIRRRAQIEDEAKLVFFGLILLAILSSLYAVFALIGDAKAMQGTQKAAHTALA